MVRGSREAVLLAQKEDSVSLSLSSLVFITHQGAPRIPHIRKRVRSAHTDTRQQRRSYSERTAAVNAVGSAAADVRHRHRTAVGRATA